MRPRPQIPAEIEEFRDERWRREATRQVETAFDAERFIEQVGFAACLTDRARFDSEVTVWNAGGLIKACADPDGIVIQLLYEPTLSQQDFS